MSTADLQSTIESAWDARDTVTSSTTGAVRDAVVAALDEAEEASLEAWLARQDADAASAK